MTLEPWLKIRRTPPSPSPIPALAVGLVGLLLVGLVPLVARTAPSAPAVIVVRGKMASKVDFFRDQTVKDILKRKNYEVVVDNVGSREIFTDDIDKYDFVFPSGQPTSDMIMAERQRENKYAQPYIPFISPIVLATYRPYAKALQDSGIARPVRPDLPNPLYYELDIGRFIELTELGKRWNDIGIRSHGIHNNNLVLAHMPDVCKANSSGTYQGLIAYAKNGGRIPTAESEAVALGQALRPSYQAQGAPTADRVPFYLSPEGKTIAPIVVIYEHQYIAHQLRRPQGQPDEDRVLLYPADHFESQPSFIALNEIGMKIAELLRTDSELRKRAVELGLRVLDSGQSTASPELTSLLTEHGLEAPSSDNDHTRAYLPPLDVFEKLITTVGGCT